ncbi:MAG: TetR/AcrR family transcriptional regulator [Ruminococcaceae bacterium]|nr:TetR/AcrR family transcriptional regulator [Oscillospiraceae bacterium]
MDRRQRKTREAIFSAFTQLLSEKNLSRITVSDIITRADIGRATFYAHFETRDYLLKELCEELFCHIFDSMGENGENHKHIFECDAPRSAFLHLVQHIEKNDNHILDLLSCQNNEMFLGYFKTGLAKLIENQYETFDNIRSQKLPKDFWTNHIAATFVETIRWWIDNKMQESPQQITEYFLISINA